MSKQSNRKARKKSSEGLGVRVKKEGAARIGKGIRENARREGRLQTEE